MGEKVLEEGLADAVAYGRLYISNPDLVERFKEKSITTAILSNGSREMLATVVQSNGLGPYLDTIGGSILVIGH